MLKQISGLHRAAVIAITAASLSLPMLPMAQADQQVKRTARASTHWKKAKAVQPERYAWAPAAAQDRCTWPYRNQFPPCMSTWPAEDPNYHGGGAGS